MTLIEIFPGQGSQRAGMGQGLFEQFPEETRQAEAVLGYSLSELCLANPRGELNQTEFTQPALFVVNALTCLQRRHSGHPVPAAAAGHSLGEYNALWAAGVFNLADGVRLVQERGRLMSQATAGGMAAVMGLGEERIRQVLTEGGLAALDIANLNASGQVVISGPRTEIERAREAFSQAGAKYVVLPVSAAFHSRYMRPVAEEFREFLSQFRFLSPAFPVYANATAEPYPSDGVTELLVRQICEQVRWMDTVRKLLALPEAEFVEVGPGAVLTNLVKRIRGSG